MDTVQQALELAQRVDAILRRYVMVHDALFGFSLRRAIPMPGVFKAIDFDSHHRQLAALNSELADASVAAGDVLKECPSESAVSAFLGALEDYVVALAETICALRDISYRLSQKAHRTGSDYSISAYNADVRNYKASIPHYRDLGKRLNPHFPYQTGDLREFQC